MEDNGKNSKELRELINKLLGDLEEKRVVIEALRENREFWREKTLNLQSENARKQQFIDLLEQQRENMVRNWTTHMIDFYSIDFEN